MIARRQVVTLLSLFVAFLILASEVRADLVATDWEELLDDSTLIVLASAENLESKPHFAGVAKLRIKEVIRGNYEGTDLEIAWTSEVHDQRIDELGKLYLLFLKIEDEHFTGAHYGRSYWPIDVDSESRRIVIYRYPITEVKMPPHFVRDQARFSLNLYPHEACGCNVRAIIVDSVLETLRGIRE